MKHAGQVYTPYSCLPFTIRPGGDAGTDIEHIVALAEAHDSHIQSDRRRIFASDLDNLTIADPRVNRALKRDSDAGEWAPDHHGAWFAERVIAVKLKYGLSVDRAERDSLKALLAGGGERLDCSGRSGSAISTEMGATVLGVPVEATGLQPNHPNPFNRGTRIAYRLGAAGPVQAGGLQRPGAIRCASSWMRTLQDAGMYQVEWDAWDQGGRAGGVGGLLRPSPSLRPGVDRAPALPQVIGGACRPDASEPGRVPSRPGVAGGQEAAFIHPQHHRRRDRPRPSPAAGGPAAEAPPAPAGPPCR